uniref:Uncharacterized protein n=1 Tax=Timema poppense TaxID=170557 RepID=A0A7R9HCK2_TIMPO|nr:unnamed protein product [Timema poppensis]
MEDGLPILESVEIKPDWDFGILIKSEPGANDYINDKEQLCITDEINIKDEPLFKDEIITKDAILITDEIHIKDEITLDYERAKTFLVDKNVLLKAVVSCLRAVAIARLTEVKFITIYSKWKMVLITP